MHTQALDEKITAQPPFLFLSPSLSMNTLSLLLKRKEECTYFDPTASCNFKAGVVCLGKTEEKKLHQLNITDLL